MFTKVTNKPEVNIKTMQSCWSRWLTYLPWALYDSYWPTGRCTTWSCWSTRGSQEQRSKSGWHLDCFRFYSSKEANVVGGRAVMEAPPPMEEEVGYIYSHIWSTLYTLWNYDNNWVINLSTGGVHLWGGEEEEEQHHEQHWNLFARSNICLKEDFLQDQIFVWKEIFYQSWQFGLAVMVW